MIGVCTQKLISLETQPANLQGRSTKEELIVRKREDSSGKLVVFYPDSVRQKWITPIISSYKIHDGDCTGGH
ncbi:hypothetical protein PCASD_10614 [Puccinia coronata f. sp. avenae]|nr:hypothetical protein PCASD_21157 [Puccinia coronata f. sp. avenae]PLW34343.1 hypothetical protein PCASD_10614 [Puccinia coronata f. sp. avenae]